ncbi:MAG: PorV/PorQ family protein [Bacteroidota bacterium]
MKKYLILIAAVIFTGTATFAGNPDRAGQAGASQLLINPWAKCSGWGGANVASVRGLESNYLNIAGTAFTKKTELLFSNTQWLAGTDIQINAFGITQKIGKEGSGGVIGLSIMSMSMGEIPITTVEQPEGGIGTFSPNLMNISLSYAKAFSNSIYGGVNFRVINENVSDIKGQGMAIDAGIQYVTGEMENIKFGISLKNVGTRMKYNGDGLSFRGYVPGQANAMTVAQRSSDFELPSLINIGGAYDFLFSEKHTLTLAGAFTSNSFTKDQYVGGLEYAFNKMFFLRCGYMYETGNTNTAERTNVLTGINGGLSIALPVNKEKNSTIELDYSYRTSNPFNGVHSFGARINL